MNQRGSASKGDNRISTVETTVGGPVIVIFHTTKETTRLYTAIVARDLEEHREGRRPKITKETS